MNDIRYQNPLSFAADTVAGSPVTPAAHSAARSQTDFVKEARKTAAGIVLDIKPGHDQYIVTRGQFSVIELLTVLLDKTGPAHVDFSTWTAKKADIGEAFEFLQSGRITGARWLFDLSFKNRQPEFFYKVCDQFGHENVRQCRNHSKLMLVSNETWKLSVLTSANLNKNPRNEFYWIRDCPDFFRFNRGWYGEYFR